MIKYVSLPANTSDYCFITNENSSPALVPLPPTQKLMSPSIKFPLLLDSLQPKTKFYIFKYSLKLPNTTPNAVTSPSCFLLRCPTVAYSD